MSSSSFFFANAATYRTRHGRHGGEKRIGHGQGEKGDNEAEHGEKAVGILGLQSNDVIEVVVAIPSTKKEGIFSDRIDCLDRVGESFCQMESTVASCSRHEAKKQERTITDVLNLGPWVIGRENGK